MHRFFVAPKQIENRVVTIAGDDYKHISKVLRLRSGDEIEVCDGQGQDYRLRIKQLSKECLTGEVVETYPCLGENKDSEITLFQGLPKASKLEMIIQKNVELGIKQIYPFSCIRSQVELGQKADKKRQRWQRIAYEAAKQSKRGIIPQIGSILTVVEIARMQAEFDLILLAYEDEKDKTLKQVVLEFEKQNLKRQAISIAIIVGPEGGFDLSEVKTLTAAGAHSVSLGKRILRTETAGLMMVSQLNFWKE